MPSRTRREVFASLSSFLGLSQKNTTLIRPPYNSNESLFAQNCPICVDAPCVRACPEAIIVLDDGKLPYIVFTQSGCTFCEECAMACPSKVLDNSLTCKDFIRANFKIDTAQCIAWNQTICQSCADVCDVHAISFFGMLRPQIEMGKCTGCGMCYAPCPSNAIVLSAQRIEKEQK